LNLALSGSPLWDFRLNLDDANEEAIDDALPSEIRLPWDAVELQLRMDAPL